MAIVLTVSHLMLSDALQEEGIILRQLQVLGAPCRVGLCAVPAKLRDNLQVALRTQDLAGKMVPRLPHYVMSDSAPGSLRSPSPHSVVTGVGHMKGAPPQVADDEHAAASVDIHI